MGEYMEWVLNPDPRRSGSACRQHYVLVVPVALPLVVLSTSIQSRRARTPALM